MIVLEWLRSNKSLPIFVQNRVSDIKKYTDVGNWNFYPTADNPADLLTRGVSTEFLKSSCWLSGPKSIPDAQPSDDAFVSSFPVESVTVDYDVDNCIQDANLSIDKIVDVNRYSSYKTLINVSAYVLRLIRNTRSKKTERVYGQLSSVEIDNVEKMWLCTYQSEFKGARDYLLGKTKKRPDIVNQLKLYLDERGLIRCKGRMQNSALDPQSNNPLLIPKYSDLSRLIIREAHTDVFHFGLSSTVAKIRERFWIPQILQSVKLGIKGCIICKKLACRPYKLPDPPALPLDRVAEVPPFYYCGVDYCGPLIVKDGTKCYISLFTCAVTRAVHLEVVRSNTTDDFLCAFKKFCARRSMPRCVISDNAAYFGCMADSLSRYFSSKRIDWKFIKKRASWHGGFWERLIGLTKAALKKTLGKRLVSFDELVTVTAEIESVLNDRPLTYVSSDFNDGIVLTPSHLLCGRRISAMPPSDLDLDIEEYGVTESDVTKGSNILVK